MNKFVKNFINNEIYVGKYFYFFMLIGIYFDL